MDALGSSWFIEALERREENKLAPEWAKEIRLFLVLL